MIENASDVKRFSSARPMVHSPPMFDGPLEALFIEFILPNLASPQMVRSYHRLLMDYCASEDPLFLVRQVRGTERRVVYHTSDGDRFRATDNAPAWWMHYALFHEIDLDKATIADVVASIPTHFHDVGRALPHSINSAGWHVAHIGRVKDGNVNFLAWSRGDLVARFLRNVHPCNCFFLPKPDWQRWGGDERVIAFFVSLYSERYKDVWSEFLAMSRIDSSEFLGVSRPIHYCYGPICSVRDTFTPSVAGTDGTPKRDSNCATVEGKPVSYSATRLLFKADVIDALGDNDRFRIVTPSGSYEMSKADFMRVFRRVSLTKSYREDRIYHYPKPPAVAAQFLVKNLPVAHDQRD